MKISPKTLLANAEAQASASSLAIRKANRHDHAAICRLLVEEHRPFEWVMPTRAYGQFVAELIDLESRLRCSELLVAERHGRIVGTVGYRPEGGRDGHPWPAEWASAEVLAIAPEVRGLGVGHALVGACVRSARLERARALGMHTAWFMAHAVELCEDLGFFRAASYDLDLAASLPLQPHARLPLLAYLLPVK